MSNASHFKPDKSLTAVCGLFCPSCTIYIGSKEEPERLQRMADRLKQSVEETHCEGCRSEKRTNYCKTCKMSSCAALKGIDFCIECSEYPCEELKRFQAVYPHRIELWQSQERIKEIGYEKWFAEMDEHFSCTDCGTINSAYDFKCRQCGKDPSCNYIRKNKEEIIRRSPVRTLEK